MKEFDEIQMRNDMRDMVEQIGLTESMVVQQEMIDGIRILSEVIQDELEQLEYGNEETGEADQDREIQ